MSVYFREILFVYTFKNKLEQTVILKGFKMFIDKRSSLFKKYKKKIPLHHDFFLNNKKIGGHQTKQKAYQQ